MVTRKELLEDLQGLGKLVRPVTRNYYRANGKFTETDWHNHFSRFTDFLNAAGLSSQQQLQEKSAPEVSDIKGDIWDITLPKTNIHTLDQLLDYCKVDLSIWKVERFIVNKWEMGYKNKLDIVDSLPLFQVKATLVRKADVVAVKREIEELMALAKQSARKPSVIERPKKLSGNVLEINIPDVHFGKFAWGEETGYGNYDVKIAAKMFMRALNALLDRSKGYDYDEVVFVVGNDILNSNDADNRTAAGTVVTTDGRYHKTFKTVRSIVIEAIEKMREIAPVRIIVVPGNHDTLSAWHLGDSLECYFHNYEDITIDNSPRYRKYYRYGNVMLMFTHGDKAKRQDYPLLMATEQPEMFGQTKYREAHTGHIHQTKMEEQHGVRVRVLPALCPPDDWHAENGYVGNLRNAEAYIWNKTEGLIATVFFCDDSQEIIDN